MEEDLLLKIQYRQEKQRCALASRYCHSRWVKSKRAEIGGELGRIQCDSNASRNLRALFIIGVRRWTETRERDRGGAVVYRTGGGNAES